MPVSLSTKARSSWPRRSQRRRLAVLSAFAAFASLTAAVLPPGPSAVPVAAPPGDSPAPAAPASPTTPPEIHITIGYAGDVLTHIPVLADTPGGQGDITAMTQAAQPWVSGVDLALCGMEVPVSPTGRPSGYPVFASPPAVVPSLRASGWDGCATASNHAWDQAMPGVVTTADALAAQAMGYSGTNRTAQEAATPYQLYTLQRGGQEVVVAELSTTYGLNGFTADPSWAVNLNDVSWVSAQAKAARQAGADVVVLHSQLGEEYSPAPVAAQTEYAQAIAATGEVDVLFGAHPHVPQTNELLAGGPGGRGMWVSYSAGNFISNQSEANGTPLTSSTGLFVWVDVTVRTGPDGVRAATVDALHWHPFTVDASGGHRLVDLAAGAGAPDGGTLTASELERRRSALMSLINPQTYSDQVPRPTGPEPTAQPRG